MVRWPFDPLGSRRAAVEQGAADVRLGRAHSRGCLRARTAGAARRARGPPVGHRTRSTCPRGSRRRGSRTTSTTPMWSPRRCAGRCPSSRSRRRSSARSSTPGSRAARSTPHAGDELDTLASESDGELVGVDTDRLAELKATFERSPWAGRRPVEVEREIHLPFDGRIVICKIDAIYAEGEGDDARYEVVDWKTGKAPKDAADLQSKQLQLALYRLAYAKWAGIPIERITAAFYFVADDRIIRPTDIDSEDDLLARWRQTFVPRRLTCRHARPVMAAEAARSRRDRRDGARARSWSI